jgi:hypothetical protein
MITYFEQIGGVEALTKLTEHKSFEIYSSCSEIIDKYFKGEQENDIDHFFEGKTTVNQN